MSNKAKREHDFTDLSLGEIRRLFGYTQAEVARHFGVNQTDVSKFENGKSVKGLTVPEFYTFLGLEVDNGKTKRRTDSDKGDGRGDDDGDIAR